MYSVTVVFQHITCILLVFHLNNILRTHVSLYVNTFSFGCCIFLTFIHERIYNTSLCLYPFVCMQMMSEKDNLQT